MATRERLNPSGVDDLSLMTATQLLQTATGAGLTVLAEGGKLLVRGPTEADEVLVEAVLRRKRELMPLLMAMDVDEIERFEERAAIAEYDGGLLRHDAERLARAEVEARRRADREPDAAEGQE